MDQISMFEEESVFPTSYEDISILYEKYIFEGETDEDVFTSRDLKKGRSYFFYGTKIIEFVPADQGKVSLKLFTFDEKPIKLDPNMPREEFLEWLEKLKAKKRYIFRNLIVETFGCCNDFRRCSAVDSCIHQEDRFYNGCIYRTNLEAGRNYYKDSSHAEEKCQYKFILGLDFETANASRSSACAIAAVKFDLEGNEIDSYYTLIDPEEPFDSFNIMIHGITPRMVEGAPKIAEAMQNVFSLIDGNTLVVCHNSAFDMSVLRNSIEKDPIAIPDFAFTCTYRLASRVLPKNVSYTLPDVAEQCGITDLVHHDAKSDAATCAKILLYLYDKFDKNFTKLHLTANLRLGYFENGEYEGIHKSVKESTGSSKNPRRSSISADQFASDPGSPFYGRIVSFTGKLESMTRDEAISIINAIGGTGTDKMSSKTNFLITGYQDPRALAGNEKSRKRIMAEEMLESGKAIEIIPEEEFLKML